MLPDNPTAAVHRRASMPHPQPGGLPRPVLLALHPLPSEAHYALHRAWAETVAGSARRTRLARTPAGA